MTDLEKKIIDLLSDNKYRDALEIARIVVGPKAFRKAVNPTLYRMERTGKLKKYPPIKGMKPQWGLPGTKKDEENKEVQEDEENKEVQDGGNKEVQDGGNKEVQDGEIEEVQDGEIEEVQEDGEILEKKIITLLSDGEARDALKISRIVVGPKAPAKTVNPVLYRMEKSGILKKYPSTKGMKPLWCLLKLLPGARRFPLVKEEGEIQEDNKLTPVSNKQNLSSVVKLEDTLTEKDEILEIIYEDEDSIEEVPIKKKRSKTKK